MWGFWFDRYYVHGSSGLVTTSQEVKWLFQALGKFLDLGLVETHDWDTLSVLSTCFGDVPIRGLGTRKMNGCTSVLGYGF